ncbi:hypothetical protein [Pediococcus acidilactici]|uniref:hypothetical protein n=1 Tax=Pediococcus acidilactici TaxID=1254 RepID=UPI0038576192
MRKARNTQYTLLSWAAILVLVIFSLLVLPASPLRSGNSWVDTNAMLRIGQLWLNGVLPFKEVFEQRGIVLYLVYLVANLFGKNGYVGLYIVEIINLIAIQIILKKIFIDCFDGKKNYEACVGSVVVPLLMITNYSFKNGGSPEEFSLPWILLSVLLVQKYFRDKNEKHFLGVGIALAIVFNIKYSLIGPWAALGMITFLSVIFEKRQVIKRISKILGFGIAGVLLVFIPIFIYLFITDSIDSFIDIYLIQNLTGYTTKTLPLGSHLLEALSMSFNGLVGKNVILLTVFPIALALIKNKKVALAIYLIFFSTQVLSYWALRSMAYMPIILLFIIYLTVVVCIMQYVDIKNVNIHLAMLCLIFVGALALVRQSNPYVSLSRLGSPNNEDLSYKFAKKIDQLGGAKTLLYYNSLDLGVERYTDIPKSMRYFERTNINLPAKDKALDNAVKDKSADFVIVNERTRKVLVHKGYKVVDSCNNYDYALVNNYSHKKRQVKYYLMKPKTGRE